MAIKKFSPLLAENPLCGIGEYKDVLDLSTGGVTRQIKKLVLTGDEAFTKDSGVSTNYLYYASRGTLLPGSIGRTPLICNELPVTDTPSHLQIGINTENQFRVVYLNFGADVMNAQSSGNTVEGLKEYLAQQYANGSPITIWYVLSTPETETITVPSGLTGTIEGYLTQSGTPIPSAPIYPEANPVLVWAHTTYRKYGTETETITSLPAQIIGDGQPITSCQISGNTVQDGTPTPEAPVDVVGCGVRTGNLFDKDATDTNNGYVVNKFLTSSGDTSSSTLYNISEYIELSPSTVYTVFIGSTPKSPSVCFYDTNKNYIEGIAYNSMDTITVTTPANAKYCRVSYVKELSDVFMLNTGSSPLPYEPYGFKLPLTCGDTEYPIYLGQVETTRKIKKLVLTGEENWTYSSSNNKKRVYFLGFDRAGGSLALCSHFANTDYSSYPDAGYFAINTDSTTQTMIFGISDMQVSDVSGWTQYLAQQYTNGTPVTVWYVLATPETAVVNEPIRKIGDYADTVTSANVPTTGTPENFDVGTTLKPSEVQLTYHGWHEHEDTKYTQGE